MTDGVCIRLERHRRVATFDGRDELEEVAVPNHNVVQATAVDVASLSCQRPDSGVDEQLLVAVGLGGGGEVQIGALAQGQLAMPVDGDVAHQRRTRFAGRCLQARIVVGLDPFLVGHRRAFPPWLLCALWISYAVHPS